MSNSMTFSVLITRDGNTFIAHCLELDIVADSRTMEGARDDLLSLIRAQIEYAFVNDNLDNLYKPAPIADWEAYFACPEMI